MSDTPTLQAWMEQQGAINKLYAHDFKNPISAISANISYLEAVLDNADPDVLGAIDDSAVALRMLLHMVENFLQISRLEAGEKLPSSAIGLERFLTDALARCHRMNPVSEPVVVLCGSVPDITCEWPLTVAELAVDNMILTALHQAASRGKVEISAALSNDRVIITCVDDGYPVSPEFVDRSFDREFQTQAKSLSNARYGRAMAMYAIGLSAKALGGQVTLTSCDGRQVVVLSVPVNVR